MIENYVRKCVLTCRDYVPGKPVEEVERELGLKEIYKMASNENPLGTSPLAMAAMQKELEKTHRYPESLCTELVASLARMHSVAPESIMVGNGLDNVITLLGMTFLSEDSEVIFGDITFPAYGNISRKMGAKTVEVPLNANLEQDLNAMAEAVTDKTKMIFICNPNNPTGTIVSHKALAQFIKKVREDVIIVIDEAYFEYATSPAYSTALDLLSQRDTLVVLRTFSKIYGLAALRIGYAVANPELIRFVMKLREPFPVNRLAQAGALAALEDVSFKQQTLRVNMLGKAQYIRAFEKMGLKFYDSQTNFIYVEINKSAQEVFQAMLHDGIIVRPQSFPGHPDALRITFGTTEENDKTIAALKKALDA